MAMDCKKIKKVYYPKLFWENKISIIDKTKHYNNPGDAIIDAKNMRRKFDKKFIVGFKKVNLFKE